MSVNLIYVLLQSKVPVAMCQPVKRPKNTYLKNFKSVNVQHSDIKLLMILHHGFVDGLKSKDCVTRIYSFVTYYN